MFDVLRRRQASRTMTARALHSALSAIAIAQSIDTLLKSVDMNINRVEEIYLDPRSVLDGGDGDEDVDSNPRSNREEEGVKER